MISNITFLFLFDLDNFSSLNWETEAIIANEHISLTLTYGSTIKQMELMILHTKNQWISSSGPQLTQHIQKYNQKPNI